jgi:SAM-dependent methyltransferase
MPTIAENSQAWGHYDWQDHGDEWSKTWGGTPALWSFTILPRIRNFLPTGRILEIAPGYGRCTAYLKDLAERLQIVDLEERCIDACRSRFADENHIDYFVNDGSSLDDVEDGSIDFAFSYDSLVHVEGDVIEKYLQELRRTLSPNGVGFLHHSNFGIYRTPDPNRSDPENVHWRGESMTAALFDQFCKSAGLVCLGQEVVNWGGDLLTDCFSTFCQSGARWQQPRVYLENPHFMEEADRVRALSDLYGADRFSPDREHA